MKIYAYITTCTSEVRSNVFLPTVAALSKNADRVIVIDTDESPSLTRPSSTSADIENVPKKKKIQIYICDWMVGWVDNSP